MAISKRAGFACAAGACVALTGTAFAGGGNDPFSAVEITGLPFTDAGSTVGLTNDFDLICPFSGSTSPDSWYIYTPDAEIALAINVCESAYDTKLYVLDAGFNEVACNDDGCSDSNGNPFRSTLVTGALTAGSEVYIVVDGYSGDLGDYNLSVEGQEPCVAPECPDGATLEGEGDGCDQTVDTNGGCNSSPFVIQDVSCGDTICGTAWADGATRDTDWFRLASPGNAADITYTVTGDFPGAYFYLGEDIDCDSVAVVTAVNPAPCETGTITQNITGESWWFAGQAVFEGFPCGSEVNYVVGWDCVVDTTCPALGDLNADSVVDFNDLLVVLSNFGPCP